MNIWVKKSSISDSEWSSVLFGISVSTSIISRLWFERKHRKKLIFSSMKKIIIDFTLKLSEKSRDLYIFY